MNDIHGRPRIRIVDVDEDAQARIALEGMWCFRCPLAERQPGLGVSGECRTTTADLEPLVRDGRSGVKAAVRGGHIVGYAVFGRPELFPGVARLGLEVDPDALLIAALYATPDAQEEHADAALLVQVMDFAAQHGYEEVVAVCRPEWSGESEPPAELLAAARFDIESGEGELRLATIGVENWEAEDEAEGGTDDVSEQH